MTICQQTVTGEAVVTNLPAGREVTVGTDAALAVAFWNPVALAYDVSTTVATPGGILMCPHSKAKITTATSANINVHLVL